MWFLYRYANPASWIFVVFNSFIHTLMYLYYAAAIRGMQLNAVKWLMTFLQIVQLVFGTALSFYYPFIQPDFRNSPMLMSGLYFSTFYTGSLIVLFVQFFFQRFVLSFFVFGLFLLLTNRLFPKKIATFTKARQPRVLPTRKRSRKNPNERTSLLFQFQKGR